MLHYGENLAENGSVTTYTYTLSHTCATSKRVWRRQVWHLVTFYPTGNIGFPEKTGVAAVLPQGIHLVPQNISQNISAAKYKRINLNGNKNDRHPKPKKK